VFFDPDNHDVLGFSIANFSAYYEAHKTPDGEFEVNLPAKVPAPQEEEMDFDAESIRSGVRIAEFYEELGAPPPPAGPTRISPGPLPEGTIGKTLASGLTWTSTSAGPSVAKASAIASSRSPGSWTVAAWMP
jgi:hypothetical protein